MTSSPPYQTPTDLVRLLDETVEAARRTVFFGAVLGGRPAIHTINGFKRLPVTPIAEYRKQQLADVVTDPTEVQWVAGAYRGQRGDMVPVAESTADTSARYDILRDALLGALPDRRPRAAAVLSAPERRFFGAEVAAVLGYHGTPTHLLTGNGATDPWPRLRILEPDILVILADDFDEARLPPSVQLCLTFRRAHEMRRTPQLDLYLVDEIGPMAHSTDLKAWVPYNDLYYFEQTAANDLVVTALRSRLRPILRLRVTDTVAHLAEHAMVIDQVSEHG